MCRKNEDKKAKNQLNWRQIEDDENQEKEIEM